MFHPRLPPRLEQKHTVDKVLKHRQRGFRTWRRRARHARATRSSPLRVAVRGEVLSRALASLAACNTLAPRKTRSKTRTTPPSRGARSIARDDGGGLAKTIVTPALLNHTPCSRKYRRERRVAAAEAPPPAFPVRLRVSRDVSQIGDVTQKLSFRKRASRVSSERSRACHAPRNPAVDVEASAGIIPTRARLRLAHGEDERVPREFHRLIDSLPTLQERHGDVERVVRCSFAHCRKAVTFRRGVRRRGACGRRRVACDHE